MRHRLLGRTASVFRNNVCEDAPPSDQRLERWDGKRLNVHSSDRSANLIESTRTPLLVRELDKCETAVVVVAINAIDCVE